MDATEIQVVEAYGTGFQWCAICAICQESGVFSELRKTGDSKVFLVRVRRRNEVLGLKRDASICRESATTVSAHPLYCVQDVRLAFIIPVGTNSKVDLAGVLVSFESLRDT